MEFEIERVAGGIVAFQRAVEQVAALAIFVNERRPGITPHNGGVRERSRHPKKPQGKSG